MKKPLLILMLCGGIAALCGAAPSRPPVIGELLQGRFDYSPGKFLIVTDSGEGAAPTLALDISSEAYRNPEAKTGGPGVLRVEFLAVLPPAGNREETGKKLEKLALIISGVNSMEGIEYWSASRQKMRTLYAEAYRVDSASGKFRQDDPASFSELGGGSEWLFRAFLRDLTFGANIVEYVVRLEKDHVFVASENVGTMRYMLLPLIPARSVKTRIVAAPAADGLAIHVISTVQAPEIAARRVFESAGNKALAVLGWFAGESARAGLSAPVTVPVDIEDVLSAGKPAGGGK